jgi:hypothetical protein
MEYPPWRSPDGQNARKHVSAAPADRGEPTAAAVSILPIRTLRRDLVASDTQELRAVAGVPATLATEEFDDWRA